MANNILTLRSEGQSFDSFQEVNVYKSLLSMSSQYSLSTYNFYEDNKKKWFLTMDSFIDLYINSMKICSGYLDDLVFDYGAGKISAIIKGRDITQDLIDCIYDQDNNEWKKQSIRSIIIALCSPFGINVNVDINAVATASTVIETFKVNECETVSKAILRLCKNYGLLAVSYGDGYLTLSNATTTENARDALEMGVNVHNGKLIQSNRDRFSKYIIKGFGVGNDNKALADYVSCVGSFNDFTVRYRPFCDFFDGPCDSGKCTNLAKWEASIRAGLSRAIYYVTRSWTQSDGTLWDINNLVRIKDSILNVDETRLIHEVRYGYNRDVGEFAVIGTVHKDTFKINNNINMKTGFDV